MGRRKIWAALALLTVCLLSGCGGEERQQGTDGYVYVSETIQESVSDSLNDFCVAGDYLYYSELTNGSRAGRRAPLKGENRAPDLSEGETVLTAEGALSRLSGETLCGGQSYDSADLEVFAADQNENLYCIINFYKKGGAETGYANVSVGAALYKQSADGTVVYCLDLPGTIPPGGADLLTSAEGDKVYVVVGEKLLLVDETGNVEASHAPSKSAVDGNEIQVRLLEGEDGSVYYTVEDNATFKRETYLLGKNLQPELVNELSGLLYGMELYGDREGLLVQKEGVLYRYRRASGKSEDSLEELLTWEDSGLPEDDIEKLAQLTDESFLALADNGGSYFLLLLSKTSVEELPEKELIVLASLDPDSDLNQIVVDFNKMSDKYHVSVETYGADMLDEASAGEARTRLESALISKDPPDLLDLAGLDVVKYAEKQMLEDLRGYMEEGPEDYLDGVLEGYTINGRLVCIPKSFSIWSVAGVRPWCQSRKSWSMEDVMKLTEEYPQPDFRLMAYSAYQDTEYLLEDFCAPYYLERFVDWEEGVCSFDSAEFGSLLEWIAREVREGAENSVPLLDISEIADFVGYLCVDWNYEDGVEMLGFPTAEGKGVFTADVRDAMGIVSKSKHKEGAWEFLKYFLEYDSSRDGYRTGFPTRRSLLEEMAEEAVTPRYVLDSDGNRIQDRDGNWFHSKGKINVNGEMVDFYALEQEQADAVMAAIEAVDFSPRSSLETSIIKIVAQEAAGFLHGSKSLEEVCGLIQNRAEVLVKENHK